VPRDIRHAFRQIQRNRVFAITTILTLALCIGANTAIYSIVDAVLFRPLPYPEPDRLVSVSFHQRGPRGEYQQTSQDGQTWKALHENMRSVDLAVQSGGTSGVNLVTTGATRYVKQARVSGGFFRVLGVPPLMGREFTESEDRPNGPAVAIVSYPLWQSTLNADPNAIGRTINLRGQPYEICGVMPAGLLTSAPADIWTPLRATTSGEGGGTNFEIVGRLRPGVAWAQANAEIETLGRGIIAMKHLPAGRSAWFQLLPLQTALGDNLRKPLMLLWGAVGLVLLIGCVNIAGLLLARGSSRTREFATRLALGSGRWALIRQLLGESLILAIAGGFAGALVGWILLRGLTLAAQHALSIWQPATLDSRVLAVTVLFSLATSLIFGVYPAIQGTRIDIRSGLSTGGRQGIRQSWSRRLLVAFEVALSVVLLVAAGLMVRTLSSIMDLRPGFDSSQVTTASLSLQDARYTTALAVNRLFDESLARIRQTPGIESAGVGLSLPYERPLNDGFTLLDGPNAGRTEATNETYVTPGYFETLRVPLRRGRLFLNSDRVGSQPVALINEAFARKFYGNGDPLGSHVGEAAMPREIVGIIGDIQQRPGLGESGPIAPVPHLYIPAAQTEDALISLVHTWFSPSWVVRSNRSMREISGALQSAVASVDPRLPFASFRTMDQVRSRSVALQRLEATLLGSIAGLALLLAGIGIYGMIASSVTERTREFGIRIALGSSVVQAISAVALPGIVLALAGLAIGSILARGAATLLHSLIWGVTPGDPLTFVGVCAVLLFVAVLASVLPSLRVARINPAETLREE
jgi:predicted permease